MAMITMFAKYDVRRIKTMKRTLPIMLILSLLMVAGMMLVPTDARADEPGETSRRAGMRFAMGSSCQLLRIPPCFPFLGPPMAGMAAPPSAYRTSVGAPQSGRDAGRGLRIASSARSWEGRR